MNNDKSLDIISRWMALFDALRVIGAFAETNAAKHNVKNARVSHATLSYVDTRADEIRKELHHVKNNTTNNLDGFIEINVE